jgi:hypothetical protein
MFQRLVMLFGAMLVAGCFTVGGDRLDRQPLSPEQIRERIETYQREDAGGQDWLIITRVIGGDSGIIDREVRSITCTNDALCGLETAWRRPRSGVEWRGYTQPTEQCFAYDEIDAVRHTREMAADRANAVAGTGMILVMSPFLLPFYIIALGGPSGG